MEGIIQTYDFSYTNNKFIDITNLSIKTENQKKYHPYMSLSPLVISNQYEFSWMFIIFLLSLKQNQKTYLRQKVGNHSW